MKAQVLLFCFSDPARLSAVRKALLLLHIPCRVVPEEDWTAPLGALAGLETEAPAAEDAAALTGEMLVMCGLTEGVETKPVDSLEFIRAIRANLEAKLA